MSTLSKKKNLAKRLLKLSLDEEGIVDEKLVIDILSHLKGSKIAGLSSLLRLFLTEIRKHENSYHAQVEIGCKKDDLIVRKLSQAIKAQTDKTLKIHTQENPALIAGYKFRLGDDVFEDSVQSRLNNLNKTFL